MRQDCRACTLSEKERLFSMWDARREPRGDCTSVSQHMFVAVHRLPEYSSIAMVISCEKDTITRFLL